MHEIQEKDEPNRQSPVRDRDESHYKETWKLVCLSTPRTGYSASRREKMDVVHTRKHSPEAPESDSD